MSERLLVRGPFPMKRPRDIQGDARPSGDETVVVFGSGEPKVLQPGELPTSSMNWFLRQRQGEYRIVHIGNRIENLEIKVPSSTTGFDFICNANVSWYASDPMKAIRHNGTDPARVMEQRILPILTTLSNNCGMDEYHLFLSKIRSVDFTAKMADLPDFVRVEFVEVTIGRDAEWLELHRRQALEGMKVDAYDEIIKGERTMAAAMSQNPEYVAKLADVELNEKIARQQMESHAARATLEFNQRMEELATRAGIRENELRFRGHLASLHARMISKDTEPHEIPGIWQEMEGLLNSIGSTASDVDPILVNDSTREQLTADSTEKDKSSGVPDGGQAEHAGDGSESETMPGDGG
ncbi:hypothetical protein [Myceligenerans crystallogenes]|uniref:SPFH domain / Band 7 family protein n=1 Tax=Myceligenerans crystallogenes TaxID=316335 RepID=A0ABP4ZG61_9MICO